MFYHLHRQKQKHKLPNDFKAQFDDSSKTEKMRSNKTARKLAKTNTRRSKRTPNITFAPVKVYKLSDKPLNYAEYLRGKYWLKLRKQILWSRNKCEHCGSLHNLNLHHRFYYRNGKSVLYRERQYTDVFEVLCYSCHMKVHNACAPAVLEDQP